jgi:hypothetical protein
MHGAIGLTVLLSTCLSASAQKIASDDFEDYALAGINHQGTATQGWTHGWQSDTANAKVVMRSLSYDNGDLHMTGGKQALCVGSASYQPAAMRYFAEQDRTVYISFLFSSPTAGGRTSDRDFFQFFVNSATTLSVGQDLSGSFKFYARASGTGFDDLSAQPDTTYLLVACFSKDAAGHGDAFDQVQLYVNPDSVTMPKSADVTAVVDTHTATLSCLGISLNLLESTDAYYIDNIRIGTTFADVVAP